MTPRTAIILLVHRIPYPPNKGDKIRSYHLLRHLAQHHDVHLGAFVDDPADLAHADTLRQWCADVFLETLGPLRSKLRMLPALLTGDALSVAAYGATGMSRWLRETVRNTGATRFVAFSTAMAQYADAMPAGARRVLDMVDVDSEKWREYGRKRRGPVGWVYRREARQLLAREIDAAAAHDAVTLVSAAEADLFRRLAPDTAERVVVIGNGVDCDYFHPGSEYPNPYEPDTRPIVFTGSMDYWPNIDAVSWFAREVLPRIRAACPQAVFHIVGTRPTAAVQALADEAGVRVIGATPDMRPWLAHAALVVAPLRIARGIQNKVLEGFAMARPVLATPMALEGLELAADYPLIAERPDTFAQRALDVLADGDDGLGDRMRAWVAEHHDWQSRLARFDDLVEPAATESRATTSRAVAG